MFPVLRDSNTSSQFQKQISYFILFYFILGFNLIFLLIKYFLHFIAAELRYFDLFFHLFLSLLTIDKLLIFNLTLKNMLF